MAVHEELLRLCGEMHLAGEALTYENILARRGKGSKRDISRALTAWHLARADRLVLEQRRPPDAIITQGGEFAERLWSSMVEIFEEQLRDITVDVQLAERYAQDEATYLGQTLSESIEKTKELERQITVLEQKLQVQSRNQDAIRQAGWEDGWKDAMDQVAAERR